MRAALAALDIDVPQWRALTRVLVKNDYDVVLAGRAGSTRAALGLFFTGAIYLLSGTLPAYVVRTSPDVLLGATMMSTFVAFMVTSSLMLGEGVAIASPDDFGVLGFRPVSSRTYLAVRVTTLLFRTLVIAALVGGPAVLAFAFKGGFRLALPAAAAAMATAGAATFAIVAMYGWLLRLIGPRRLVRIMSYAQLVANSFVWVGFFVASQGLQKHALGGLRIDSAVLILSYPGCWFGSWVDLASGTIDGVRIAAALLSVALLGAVGVAVGGRLSLDYNERLASLALSTGPSRPVTRGAQTRGWSMLRNEARAVAILLRSHFREDMKFRVGIISFVPLTVFYMVMGLRGAPPTDPFVVREGNPDVAFFLQFVLFFMPFMLRNMITFSTSHEASWIFHATPADKSRLVSATRNVVAVYFLAPYLAFVLAMFTWYFGSAWHAFLHTLFLGSISYLVLQLTVLADPELPFSRKPSPRAGVAFGAMFGATLGGTAVYFAITRLVYRSPVAMVVTLAAFVGATVLVDRLTARRATRRFADAT